jgi:hypothetical protein
MAQIAPPPTFTPHVMVMKSKGKDEEDQKDLLKNPNVAILKKLPESNPVNVGSPYQSQNSIFIPRLRNRG